MQRSIFVLLILYALLPRLTLAEDLSQPCNTFNPEAQTFTPCIPGNEIDVRNVSQELREQGITPDSEIFASVLKGHEYVITNLQMQLSLSYTPETGFHTTVKTPRALELIHDYFFLILNSFAVISGLITTSRWWIRPFSLGLSILVPIFGVIQFIRGYSLYWFPVVPIALVSICLEFIVYLISREKRPEIISLVSKIRLIKW